MSEEKQPIKIEQKIVDWQVKKNQVPNSESKIEVVETKIEPSGMNENVKRESILFGRTYKVKPNLTKPSYYITINNQEVDGVVHPFEMLIESKNIDHFQWVKAITRLVSAIFRKGGDVSFIVEEFEAIYDPAGSYWGKDKFITKKSRQYNSIVHELGEVIKLHLAWVDILNAKPITLESTQLYPHIYSQEEVQERIERIEKIQTTTYENATKCPECGEMAFVVEGGCPTCKECGYSKCS